MTQGNQEQTSGPEAPEQPNFYDIYADVAGRVVDTISNKHRTHGNPEMFGECFAALLTAYARPIVQSGRPFLPADAFVILDLLKTARIACGGPHQEHFHDKAGYALLGQVHIASIEAQARARHAAAQAATDSGGEAGTGSGADKAPAAPGGAALNGHAVDPVPGAEWTEGNCPLCGQPDDGPCELHPLDGKCFHHRSADEKAAAVAARIA